MIGAPCEGNRSNQKAHPGDLSRTLWFNFDDYRLGSKIQNSSTLNKSPYRFSWCVFMGFILKKLQFFGRFTIKSLNFDIILLEKIP